MTTPPARAAVRAALAKYLRAGFPKARFALKFSSPNGMPCFCIEGVFYAVALELGYPGEFVERQGSPREYLFQTAAGTTWRTASTAVLDYLGLPSQLTTTQCIKHFGSLGWAEQFMPKIPWCILNDHSSLSLDKLLEFALSCLPPIDHKSPTSL